MKIVIVSDTHTQHETFAGLSGDVLIHCGDFCLGRSAGLNELRRIDEWFGRQRFKLILCTGGNHDVALEEASIRGLQTFANAVYLEDRPFQFEGVKFYGAPWVPELKGWAFYQSDRSLEERWAKIPADTDILITHTPPYGILDSNSQGRMCGCPSLKDRLSGLRLRLHCFGHVHASAGVTKHGRTTYVNASVVNRTYQVVRAPIEIEM